MTPCGNAGAASGQGANTGSQGQKKKRRKLLVNLAEPKASHATSDAAVSLMPDLTASSHHATRAQTAGGLCNMARSEPVQGKLFCSC